MGEYFNANLIYVLKAKQTILEKNRVDAWLSFQGCQIQTLRVGLCPSDSVQIPSQSVHIWLPKNET